MHSGCAYCGAGPLDVATTGTRPRPSGHHVVTCGECGGHAYRKPNARVYPLADRTDPDSDPVNRVID